MQAQEKSYSQIVQSDASAIHHYHVPKYQRAYSWTLPNWEQLYDDINDNEPGHFIGSVICISDSRPSMPGQQVVQELVDGQQRMTTLSLLLAAIHYQLNQMLDSEEAQELDEEDLDDLKDKKKRLAGS